LEKLKFKSGDCPREQLWFQENGKYFAENWHKKYNRWESEIYPEFLKKFQDKIQTHLKTIDNPLITTPNINSCLINKYYNGSNSIKAHRDNQFSFGKYPTIIGISIGASRYIKLQRLDNKQEHSFLLENGSMYIMAGSLQEKYLHSIPKCECNDIRYSLTFREHLSRSL
jgi:alkylated DNA repair dioxygenase AlkB